MPSRGMCHAVHCGLVESECGLMNPRVQNDHVSLTDAWPTRRTRYPINHPAIFQKPVKKKPTPAKKKPDAAAPKKIAAKTKATSVTKKKPVVAKKKPLVTKKKPVVTKKKPVVAKKKPVATEEKPVAKARKANATKPTTKLAASVSNDTPS